LESIIDNHEGEELLNIARKKWELIVERESLENEIKEEPQSFIEISEEEFDYDLEEFLVEEIIDEDYLVVAPDTLYELKKDSIELIHEKIETDEIE